jgi:hypothetical protein
VKDEAEFYRRKSGALWPRCKPCARAINRAKNQTPERRAFSRAWVRAERAREPEKMKARDAVRAALASGALVRLPCEVCGRADTHGHHVDYARPLDVRWLCPLCHKAAHRGEA